VSVDDSPRSDLRPEAETVPRSDLLSAAEAAHRLGVKRATLYAYVSRGLLERHPSSTHRNSRFSAAAVERLAAGSRRPNRSGALEVVVETELTALDPAGRLSYRGHDVTELARFRQFEDVAGLLWGGAVPLPWELDDDTADSLTQVRRALPASTAPAELIPVAVAVLGVSDPGRGDRRPEAVRRAGVRIYAGALALMSDGSEPEDRSVARRLWAVLAPTRRPGPAQVAALNGALILLADHELAASTLAARVAASTWADPYRVVLAGLGPIGGALHGGASLAVASLLNEIDSPAQAYSVLERRLGSGSIPGFGHRIYRDGDPRAGFLLARLSAVAEVPGSVEMTQAVLEAAAALGVPAPNVDFALAVLLRAWALPATAAPTVFSLARITGLLAHGLEEYPHRLRFRPRATYVGPAPPAR
jgi:citrate synthase